MPGPLKKIMLVDDHDMIRRGVRALLEGRMDVTVVAEAGNAIEAIRLARETCPDIAVLDLSLPGGGGIDLTTNLKRQHPTLKVMILTLHDREEMVRAAIEAGADAFILKSGDEDQLLAAIDSLAVGRMHFSEPLIRELVVKIRSARPSAASADRLTRRERSLVVEIAEGRTTTDIARIWGVSPKTVETHRAAARSKLKAESTADLVRYAVRNGLIEA